MVWVILNDFAGKGWAARQYLAGILIFAAKSEDRLHLSKEIKQGCFRLHSVCTIFAKKSEDRLHLSKEIKQGLCSLHSVCTIFAARTTTIETMTSLELSSELFRELSIISQDETMMQKAVKALRRITEKMRAKDATRTEQELYVEESLTRAVSEVRAAKQSGTTLQTAESFLSDMQNGFAV